MVIVCHHRPVTTVPLLLMGWYDNWMSAGFTSADERTVMTLGTKE